MEEGLVGIVSVLMLLGAKIAFITFVACVVFTGIENILKG